MKHLRGLLCAWPWLVVLVAAIWMGSPLWQAQDVVYGRIAGDGLATPWLYDWVARTLLSGGDLSTVGDFGFRNEFQRYRDFPSALDAYLAAPTSWLLEWPMQYSGAQGWALILNGLGVAALAWAMGCRGMGIAVAGVLGASLEPVWKELWYARMNAAWPGVAALALASWLVVIQPGENGRRVWVTGVGALMLHVTDTPRVALHARRVPSADRSPQSDPRAHVRSVVSHRRRSQVWIPRSGWSFPPTSPPPRRATAVRSPHDRRVDPRRHPGARTRTEALTLDTGLGGATNPAPGTVLVVSPERGGA